MARKEREPMPLSALMPKLVAGRRWGDSLLIGRLRDEWPAVVGEVVAARCEPIRLAGGTLQIRAQAGAWASELTLLAASIAARVDEHLGGGKVREVTVVSSPSAGGRSRPEKGL